MIPLGITETGCRSALTAANLWLMALSSEVAALTVYSKPDCHLCAEAMNVLRRLQAELGFVLQELDITADEALHRAYFERIPVVFIDGEELLQYFVDEAVVRERLESRR
jgi:glutaredoxin